MAPHQDMFGSPFNIREQAPMLDRDPTPEEFDLFDEESIRDTASHRPLTLVPTQRGQARSLFRVRNGLDQSVTFTLVGDTVNDPAGAPDIGGATPIAAGSSENIATDIWAPWLGVRAAASVAPTTGTIDVVGVSE